MSAAIPPRVKRFALAQIRERMRSSRKAAFPDGGTQVMRYFSDRIVSEGFTETTSRGVTTLVNSVNPLFARA